MKQKKTDEKDVFDPLNVNWSVQSQCTVCKFICEEERRMHLTQPEENAIEG